MACARESFHRSADSIADICDQGERIVVRLAIGKCGRAARLNDWLEFAGSGFSNQVA